MTNEWTKPEHAEAYLARMKDIPHRVEGESTLLSEVPTDSKRGERFSFVGIKQRADNLA
jgi:hypothetical protein